MITDTHCHLDLITQDDLALGSILEECKKAQISSLINVSVDLMSNFNNEKLTEKHKEIYFTAGLHPHEARRYTPDDLEKIEGLLKKKKCVAIGEVGIDLYYDKDIKKEQMELFEKFLYLAKKHDKPVMIHSRDAFQEVFEFISKPEFRGLRGVFHCYSYTLEEAKKCMDHGYKISFAGNLTYKNSRAIQDTARGIPLSEIFLETDAPFLSPVPMRGKMNFPYYILYIARFLSQIRNEDYAWLLERIESNVKTFFMI